MYTRSYRAEFSGDNCESGKSGAGNLSRTQRLRVNRVERFSAIKRAEKITRWDVDKGSFGIRARYIHPLGDGTPASCQLEGDKVVVATDDIRYRKCCAVVSRRLVKFDKCLCCL